MNQVVKASAIIIGLILIVVLIFGVTAVFAQDGNEEAAIESAPGQRLSFVGPVLNRLGQGLGPRVDGRDLEGVTPWDELLAGALGVTVDDLQAARAEAQANRLAEMVEAGYLDQEQVDLMVAIQSLKGALNGQEILATALGLEVSELAAAREEGARLAELLEEAGLSPREFREAVQDALEEAVMAAVPETISLEQAELILERMPKFNCRCWRPRRDRMPGHQFPGHRFRGPGGPGFSPGFGFGSG